MKSKFYLLFLVITFMLLCISACNVDLNATSQDSKFKCQSDNDCLTDFHCATWIDEKYCAPGTREQSEQNLVKKTVPANQAEEIQDHGNTITINIPADSIDQEIELTIEKLADQPKDVLGDAFNLGPEDTTFNKPVTISLSYQDIDLETEQLAPSNLALYTYEPGKTDNEKGKWVKLPDNYVDETDELIWGSTTHFSIFAIREEKEKSCHLCPAVDTKRCHPENNTVEICKENVDDKCRIWETDTQCTPNQSCQNGKCKEKCNPCEEGQKSCSGTEISLTCAKKDETCTHWEENSCGINEMCQNGKCCPDGCTTQDQSRCLQDTVQVCKMDTDSDCLTWTDQDECTGGSRCIDGKCECNHHCAKEGEKYCSGDFNSAVCTKDKDTGCLVLTKSDCAQGTLCLDGECKSCNRCTTEGEEKCEGNELLMVCEYSEYYSNGHCLNWSESQMCQDGFHCSEKSCQQCPFECTVGKSICQSGEIATCFRDDSNNCWKWVSEECTAGESCQDGVCQ